MQKILKTRWLLILCVAVFVACTDSTPEIPQEPVDKSIFMYLPHSGSTSLYNAFQQNIRDVSAAMKEMRGLGGCRLVIFISDVVSRGRFIELRYDAEADAVVRDTIEVMQNPEVTTADGVAAILGKMKQIAPAQKYAMLVGSHGDGWLPASNSGPNKALMWYGSSDAEYRTDLTTLAKAIEQTGIHMELMAFDICYMSCVETAYDLRRVTDWIIGSTSEVMSYGMPYKRVLRHLVSSAPDYQQFVDDYIGFYSTYYYPYATIGVTRCEHLDDMAALMREINSKHTISSEQLARVQDLDALHHTPNIYIDFGDYVDKMLGDASAVDADAADLLKRFHAALDKLVPYKGTTGEIMSMPGYNVITVEAFSGLSISDATTNPLAVQTKTNTAWWKATH